MLHDTFLRDVHFSLRTLLKSPGFTFVAVVTLALGLGATTSIFTIVNDFLLRPLPFGNSNRIVTVKRYDKKLAQSGWTDAPSFNYWQDKNRVFEEMAAWCEATKRYNLTGAEGPERVSAKKVSSGFFRVLGIKPILGRIFSAADDRNGTGHVAMIGHALWQKRYAGNPTIIGKSITLDGEGFTVVGVLPAGFQFSTTPEEVWTLWAGMLDQGTGGFNLNVIALLKPGVTIAQADANLRALTAQLHLEFPDEWSSDQSVGVESLRNEYVRDFRPALLTLLTAAALVLLIGCANLSNLLLARSTIRHKEIAIRSAIGATRGRLIRQLLTESLLLAVFGLIVGLLLTLCGTRLLYAALPYDWLPLTRGGLGGTVLISALAISLVAVMLFGSLPAWSATRFDLNEALKESVQNPLHCRRGKPFRAMLVVGEVALAAILLTGTGLLLRSFVRISEAKLGFQSQNVLSFDLNRTGNNSDGFYNTVLDRVAALPNVRAAGAISTGPLSHKAWDQDIIIEGRSPRRRGDLIWASHRSVTIGYFRAMEIPLLKGRSFLPTDWENQVAIISDSMAKRYWPDENPVGRRFGVNCADVKCNWTTVIGVVGDVKELGPTGEPAVAMYFPETMSEMTLVIRAAQQPASLAVDVANVVHSVDAEQPIGSVQSMEQAVADDLAPKRLTMVIAGLFAGLALTLAVVGLYGVISYSVVLHSHEFGIRMALGAGKKEIVGLVLKQGVKLTLLGLGIGMVCALALTRFLSSLLYGVRSTDPVTLALVLLILAAVALCASYIPSRRAMSLDPVITLRHE